MRVVLLASEEHHAARAVGAARDLAGAGHEVVLALLEDAVRIARPRHHLGELVADAVAAGVRVLVDDEALARVAARRVADGLKPTDLGEVVDLLLGWSDRQVWL